MIKIAVTGGISSGKSSVCRIFEKLGAYVVDADDIVHDLLKNNLDVRDEIVALLGDDVVVDGEIDRKKIAQKVFTNRASLVALEKIVHPLVYGKINLLAKKAEASKKKLL